jgi:hypothetical protein
VLWHQMARAEAGAGRADRGASGSAAPGRDDAAISDSIAVHGRTGRGRTGPGSTVRNRPLRQHGATGWRGDASAAGAGWEAPDARRRLQLALGGIWLLDAVLQYQSFMFTRAFARTLAASAGGNPALVADPIIWSARLIAHHAVAMNSVFATVQLLLAIGIAWRPTVKIALGASIAWSLAVWWLGEGLGSVLTGKASPLTGAPGAVIIYALLAILLWPAATDRPSAFVAGRAVGAPVARALWLALWGGLACLSLQPAVLAGRGLDSMISAMAPGAPGWLATIDRHLGGLLGHYGLTVSIVLAVTLGIIAAGVYLPPAARAAVVLAIAVAAVIWAAEALGGVFTGAGTDPNSGPLLALLAVAYWPSGAGRRPAAAASPAVTSPDRTSTGAARLDGTSLAGPAGGR